MIAPAYVSACHDELRALKPGNVHDFAPGHRMTVADFEASAKASAPFIAQKGASVGARIFGAMEATWAAAGANTNLGILLLCAPLAVSAESGRSLDDVLASLTVEDARLAYRAIAIASPAGLGSAEQHDVRRVPDVTLLQAMTTARDRDRIANAYATGFADIRRIGLKALASAPRHLPWLPATAVYLAFLTACPDSHIARKHGGDVAREVQLEAKARAGVLDWSSPVPQLLEFDASLKARNLNPGTSADLTVATLFANRLSSTLRFSSDNG